MKTPGPPLTLSVPEFEKIREGVVVLDVREPYEYKEFHLEGCVHIPLGSLAARCERELNRSDQIVVYCAHGVRSLDGALILKEKGFEKVRSLDGGLAAWMENHGR